MSIQKDENPKNDFKTLQPMMALQVPMNQLNLKTPPVYHGTELMMGRQYNLSEILGQMYRVRDLITIEETMLGGHIAFAFNFGNALGNATNFPPCLAPSTSSTSFEFSTLGHWFTTMRFDLKVTVSIQGFKQCQGLLGVVKWGGTYNQLCRYTRKNLKKGETVSVRSIMRLPKMLIPMMKPAEVSFTMHWNSPFPSYLQDRYANTPSFAFDNGTYFVAVLDPLQTVVGVEHKPVFQIFHSLENIQYGPYTVKG